MTRTWHHGLVARWWGEFNHGGDDVGYFLRCIQESGQPVLDAGCGSGRILVPLREAGIDIDGSDPSEDMLSWCQRALDERSLDATTFCAPMHALEPARKYKTVIVCGAFGLGGSREDDLEGLRRIHECLEPGGQLIMDHYLPTEGRRRWMRWVEQPELPENYGDREDARTAADGTTLSMNARTLEFNPMEQTLIQEIRVRHLDGDEVLAEETYDIRINMYFKNEIELMLRAAGFGNIVVTGNLDDRPPEPWRDLRIVFRASRSASQGAR